MKKSFIIFILLFLVCEITSQALSNEIDSLLREINSLQGLNKASALNRLSVSYLEVSPKNSLRYAQQANELSKTLNEPLALATSLKNIGLAYEYMGKFKEALDNYLLALDLARKKQFDNLHQSLANNIGIIFKNRGFFNKSLEYNLEALSLAEKINSPEKTVSALLNIGNIYLDLENYTQATEYYKKSLDLSYKTNNEKGIILNLINLGSVFEHQGDNKKALYYYEKAKTSGLKNTNDATMGMVLFYIGNLNRLLKKYDLAESYYMKSMDVFQKAQDSMGIARILRSYGLINIIKKNFKSAESFFLKSLALSQRQNYNLITMDVYKDLSDLYSQMGDPQSAHSYLKQFVSLKDTLLAKENMEKLLALRVRYDFEQKEKEIYRLNKNNELQETKLHNDKIIMIVSLIFFVLLLILSVILTIILINRNRAYKNLVQVNMELVKNEYDCIKLKESLMEEKTTTEPAENESLKYDSMSFLNTSIIDSNTGFVMSNEHFNKLLKNILLQLNEKRVFLDPRLTIDSLAENLNTNRTYISKVVNEAFNMNFNNFVNSYRVKEAVKILSDKEYQNYTLENIATLAGFNNKTTFNTTFKKYTGITPSFFRDNLQEKTLHNFV